MINNDLNNVQMTGTLDNFEIIYQNEKEIFYKCFLNVVRGNSGIIDSLPITISDTLLENIDIYSTVSVKGQLRSKDTINENDGKLKLSLYIYVLEIENCPQISKDNNNSIQIQGYVVKRPNLRTTPSGKQITDLLIACNYGKDKSSYIPCIAWGRNARFSSKLNIGDYIYLDGKFQSRKYNKIVDNKIQEKIAYELSINSIQLNNDNMERP